MRQRGLSNLKRIMHIISNIALKMMPPYPSMPVLGRFVGDLASPLEAEQTLLAAQYYRELYLLFPFLKAK